MGSLSEKIVANSEAMQNVQRELEPLVNAAAPLLFWGETKSGMGHYARSIHEVCPRTGKFVVVPGFSIDDDTVKQQFLGAGDDPGWVEEAHNGTIFVRRISETSPLVQQALLQLIGNQSADGRLQFSRKGRTDSLEINVRFVFSMTHEFTLAVQDDLLRRDFVEELKKRGKIVNLPPLRKRREDIVAIAKSFLEPLNTKYHQHIADFDDRAQQLLTEYLWPGNVDELKRVIEGIFAHYADLAVITEDHLPEHIRHPEITEGNYSFKLKDDTRFIGKILSPFLTIQTDTKTIRLNTGELLDIQRMEDTKFAPPKFQHFVFKLKDGSQLVGNIKDRKMLVSTSFDSNYQIIPQEIASMFLS
jgi:DNA-binding NtrC family response regulator